MLRLLLTLAVAMLLPAGRADATVYSWRDAAGVFHFTNREDVVPPGQLEAFSTFTEIAAPPADPGDDERVAEGDAGVGEVAEADASRAYVEGVQAGIRLAEEQLRLARDLAREPEEELQPIAAPTFYVPQPPPVVVSVVPAVEREYSGAWGPCGFGGCTSFLVGPTFGGRRFHHGRAFRRGHRFGAGSSFVVKHGSRGIRAGRGGSCFRRR